MHYKQLLDITSRFTSGGAYEKALQDLQWHSSGFDIEKAFPIFERFLGEGEFYSLRGGDLGKEEMVSLWPKDVEPYAMALEGELLENLYVDKKVDTKEEKLRIGVAIEHIYSALSEVPGVGDTNASKLLHLRLPYLFVMTDRDIRSMFKEFCSETFSPYSYAFNFLAYVKSDVNEALDSLCEEKHLTRQQGVEFLRNSHGRKRSLAKLMDECYYILAHKPKEFPLEYFPCSMRHYK